MCTWTGEMPQRAVRYVYVCARECVLCVYVDWGDATEGRQVCVCVCVCERVCVLCVYVDWGDATEGRQVCVCLYVCIYNPCKFCNVD